MRTIPIRSVIREIIDLHGVNPRRRVSLDMAESICNRANKRVNDLVSGIKWAEWNVTEERAYRQVWHANAQYKRISDLDGAPEEVFYIGSMAYFKVIVDAPDDPPIGTLPTDATYWAPLDPVFPYIEYEQRCKRPIGIVLGIYTGDPRLVNTCNTSCNGSNKLSFWPGTTGVDVISAGGPTVFVLYQRPKPVYTFVPKATGRIFNKGDVTYDPESGECYKALSTNMTDVADTSVWRRVPFLALWKDYVVYGAFADTVRADKSIPTAERLALASDAENIANGALMTASDAQSREHQVSYWTFTRQDTTKCCSVQWSGGTVTSLTDACDDEGAVTPISTLGVVDYYYSDVVALRRSTASPALDEIRTTNLSVKSIARIVIDPVYPGTNYQGQQYRLVNGTADSLDPGQVSPLDYGAFNSKYWERI